MCTNSPHFNRNPGAWTPVIANAGLAAIFPYNGIYTKDLDKWIEVFQYEANKRGNGPLTVDGRINQAPVGWGNSKKKAGTWYTIQALNLLTWRFCEVPYSNLHTLSDLPGMLKSEFSRFEFANFD